MADNYEPNASNIMNVGQAASLGQSQADNFTGQYQQGADFGQQLQQKIMQTQAMKSDLQKKMFDNHLAMQDHIMDNVKQLTLLEPNTPKFKYLYNQALQNLRSSGNTVDEEAFKAVVTDPESRAKLLSGVSKLGNLDPQMRSQAITELSGHVNSPEALIDLGEKSNDIAAKFAAANAKVNNTYQTRADKIRDQVKGINQKWDTTEQFTDNALNILSKPGLAQTGPGQTLLQEAYTRSGSGSAIRSFTLQLGQENRSLSNKMQGALDKLETGAKLQPDELKAMGQGLQIFKGNANKYRDNEVSTYHSSAKSIMQQAGPAGYQIKPSDMIPDDQWTRLDNLEQQNQEKKNNPKPEASSKNPPKSPSVNSYSPGSNKEIDDFVGSMIKSRATYQQVNKILGRKKLKMSQEDYNSMKAK